VPDPQCALGGIVDHTDPFGYDLATTDHVNVNNNCTLLALADAQTGNIVLQQPAVGTIGNLGQNTIRGVGNWSLDGNLGKTFRISESKSVQVRVDATNVLNHPQPIGNNVGPNVSLSGANTDFGSITSKTGSRSFQGLIRFSF
jgi:hypothetical protein